jgi:hypothetical protein
MKTETVLASLSATVEGGGGSARQAARELVRLTVYSYVIGNGDLHGKNYSIHVFPSGPTVIPGCASPAFSASPACSAFPADGSWS